MLLSLADVCSLATRFVQNRADIPLSEASLYANLAVDHIRTRLRTRAEEGLAVSSTTSGENKISLPTDFGFPINLSNLSLAADDDRRILTQTEVHEFDSRSTFLGAPQKYALYASWAELWPSPDSSYSIQLRYGTKTNTVVLSTDTPNLDSRYHLAWAYKTAELVAASRDDLEHEAVNRQRFLSEIGSQPDDRALQQRDKQSMKLQYLRERPR